jgi:diguanylate cyclase (GGDEF)-like protein
VSAALPPSSHHDELTGLPNRRLLDDRLRQALHLARRRDAPLAVLLISLGALSPGDARLVEAARRIAVCLRRADTFARYGTAEFALVLADVRGEAQCRLAAERVLQALADAAPNGALEPAIGIALYPGDAVDAEALLRNAEAALYRARQRGEALCFCR